MDVTVVIPVRNAAEYLGCQLEALARQETALSFEVVLADNGSTDRSIEVARRWSAELRLRVVDASGKEGAAYARNVAVRAVDASRVLMCDADDVVGPRWVESMVHALGSADLVAGPRRLDTLNDAAVVAAYERPPLDDLQVSHGFLPFAPSCNCGVRRPVFDAVGGFDEDLVGGAEDVDFSWRAQLAGFTIAFVPDAWIHYRLRSDVRGAYRQALARARAERAMVQRYRAHGVAASGPNLGRTLLWLLGRAPSAAVNRPQRLRWARRAGTLRGRASTR